MIIENYEDQQIFIEKFEKLDKLDAKLSQVEAKLQILHKKMDKIEDKVDNKIKLKYADLTASNTSIHQINN